MPRSSSHHKYVLLFLITLSAVAGEQPPLERVPFRSEYCQGDGFWLFHAQPETGFYYYLERNVPPSTNWIAVGSEYIGSQTNVTFFYIPTNRVEFYRMTRFPN